MEKIESKNNQHIKYVRSLLIKKYRKENKQFLIEGDHLIKEAYSADYLKELLMIDIDLYPEMDVKKIIINDVIANSLKTTTSGNRVFGLCDFLKDEDDHQATRILILDNVADPGNVGSLIRSAYSFGFDLIILTSNSVDIYNEKVIRSSQGAVFHIPIIYRDVADIINDKRLNLVVSDVNYGANLADLSFDRLALVVGNEGAGVSKLLSDYAQTLVKIETCAFESLNVAAAGAIMLYHFRKK